MHKRKKKTRVIALLLTMTLGMVLSPQVAAQHYGDGGFLGKGGTRDNIDVGTGVFNQGFSGTGVGLGNQGFGGTNGSLTNQGFVEAPLGNGLFVLLAAGAGYTALKKKKQENKTTKTQHKMKKLNTIIMALVLALGLTQCKKEQPASNDINQGETYTINLSVKGNNNAKVDVNTTTGAVDYAIGDQIHVASGGNYKITIADGVDANQADGVTFVYPAPETTITWNSAFIGSIDHEAYNDPTSISQDGITVSFLFGAGWSNSTIILWSNPDYQLTFSSTVGNISKIEIYYSDVENMPEDQGWTYDGTKMTWVGTLASSVTLVGNASFDVDIHINYISQIVFTVQ